MSFQWWQVDKLKPLKLFDENRSVSGFHLRHLLYKQNGHDYVKEVVEKIFKLWQDGQIKPIIDSTYAFEDVSLFSNVMFCVDFCFFTFFKLQN